MTAAALAAPVSGAAAPVDVGSPAVPLSTCWSSDAGLPSWGSPTFTPSTVDVTDEPAEVTVSLPVQDHGGPGPATGVIHVEAHVLGQRIRMARTSNDVWTGTVTVQRRTAAGEHAVESVLAIDSALNTHDSSRDELEHPELQTPLTVISDPPSEPAPAPLLTSLTVSKTKIDVRRKSRTVAFHLTVDETAAKVQQARLLFNEQPEREVVLRRTTDGFAGTATVPRGWFGTYRAKVASVLLLDEFGFTHRTFARELARRFGVEPVRVVSRADRRPPKVVWAKVSPRSVDVRKARRKVTVTVRARDDSSGVKSVEVNLGPHVRVELRKVKGIRRSGTWRGTVRLGPCDDPYRRGIVRLQVKDRALRSTSTIDTRLRVRTNDVQRPSARLPHPDLEWRNWPATGPIRVVFNERVTGVNPSSLQVVGRDDGLHWGAPLAGTLTCRNAGGSRVNCGSTRVRKVHWRPDPGVLAPGEQYAVVLNPDGILDIRDRSGNPARRATHLFGTHP